MENVLLDTDREMTTAPAPGFTIPYAIAGALIALMLAIFGFDLSQNARLTAVETTIAAPSKDSAQIAAVNQKLTDFQEEYERDRVNDRVVQARENPR